MQNKIFSKKLSICKNKEDYPMFYLILQALKFHYCCLSIEAKFFFTINTIKNIGHLALDKFLDLNKEVYYVFNF